VVIFMPGGFMKLMKGKLSLSYLLANIRENRI